jgi:dihydroflavonol-4-reductase
MILVTGATGLVGSHLLFFLIEQGHLVKALYRNEKSKGKVRQVFKYNKNEALFEKIEWFQADILDISLLEKAFVDVDFVYHCAALVSFDPFDEELLRKVNIEGTANVVNCCLDFRIKKLCYVSSIAALGDLAAHESHITETTEWNPEVSKSDYAISKYGAELEVWRAYQEGLPIVIVNPGVILGPLFWREGSGDIYHKIEKGLLFYTKGGTGFVSVYDVVKIMMELMNSAIVGERFILVSETQNYQEIFEKIAKKLQVQPPRIHAKKWMTQLANKIDWFLGILGKKRMFSKHIASSLHFIDYYDNSKIKTTLGNSFETIDVFFQKLK